MCDRGCSKVLKGSKLGKVVSNLKQKKKHVQRADPKKLCAVLSSSDTAEETVGELMIPNGVYVHR
jgi:hypothetical protein